MKYIPKRNCVCGEYIKHKMIQGKYCSIKCAPKTYPQDKLALLLQRDNIK